MKLTEEKLKQMIKEAMQVPACQWYPECPKEKHPPKKERDFYLSEDGYRTKEFVFCWKLTPD